MPPSKLPNFDPNRLKQVADQFGLRLVVLFGSWARWRPMPGPDSDVDIAVLGCGREAYWECFKALGEVFPGHMLDLVRLEEADPLFRHEVMSESVLLWGDPDQYYEHRAYAYRDFTDSADLFALERTLHKKKMAILRRELNDSP